MRREPAARRTPSARDTDVAITDENSITKSDLFLMYIQGCIPLRCMVRRSDRQCVINLLVGMERLASCVGWADRGSPGHVTQAALCAIGALLTRSYCQANTLYARVIHPHDSASRVKYIVLD